MTTKLWMLIGFCALLFIGIVAAIRAYHRSWNKVDTLQKFHEDVKKDDK